MRLTKKGYIMFYMNGREYFRIQNLYWHPYVESKNVVGFRLTYKDDGKYYFCSNGKVATPVTGFEPCKFVLRMNECGKTIYVLNEFLYKKPFDESGKYYLCQDSLFTQACNMIGGDEYKNFARYYASARYIRFEGNRKYSALAIELGDNYKFSNVKKCYKKRNIYRKSFRFYSNFPEHEKTRYYIDRRYFADFASGQKNVYIRVINPLSFENAPHCYISKKCAKVIDGILDDAIKAKYKQLASKIKDEQAQDRKNAKTQKEMSKVMMSNFSNGGKDEDAEFVSALERQQAKMGAQSAQNDGAKREKSPLQIFGIYQGDEIVLVSATEQKKDKQKQSHADGQSKESEKTAETSATEQDDAKTQDASLTLENLYARLEQAKTDARDAGYEL